LRTLYQYHDIKSRGSTHGHEKSAASGCSRRLRSPRGGGFFTPRLCGGASCDERSCGRLYARPPSSCGPRLSYARRPSYGPQPSCGHRPSYGPRLSYGHRPSSCDPRPSCAGRPSCAWSSCALRSYALRFSWLYALISCAWSFDPTRPFVRPCGSTTVPFDVRGTRRTRGDPAGRPPANCLPYTTNAPLRASFCRVARGNARDVVGKRARKRSLRRNLLPRRASRRA